MKITICHYSSNTTRRTTLWHTNTHTHTHTHVCTAVTSTQNPMYNIHLKHAIRLTLFAAAHEDQAYWPTWQLTVWVIVRLGNLSLVGKNKMQLILLHCHVLLTANNIWQKSPHYEQWRVLGTDRLSPICYTLGLPKSILRTFTWNT
jgi:hypothetical protein